MVELMRDHKEDLGIDATVAQFDSVFARTNRLLQQETLELELSLESRDSDTAFFRLDIQNLAGHKFPSGYPARLALVEFVLTDDAGDTLFASGLLDADQRIIGRDADYEAHYDVIRSEDEVQIYELVMADVEGNVTTVLERAETAAKDNRIPPVGFTNFHSTYDTTRIVGLAEIDENFNTSGKAQGTGKDLLYYHVPLYNYSGEFTAHASVLYQPLPPRWMDEMFAESSEEIDYFKGLYNSQSPAPVVISVDSLTDGAVSISPVQEWNDVEVYGNRGQIRFESEHQPIELVRVFALSGQQLGEWNPNTRSGSIAYPFNPGIYIVEVSSGEFRMVKKMMLD